MCQVAPLTAWGFGAPCSFIMWLCRSFFCMNCCAQEEHCRTRAELASSHLLSGDCGVLGGGAAHGSAGKAAET